LSAVRESDQSQGSLSAEAWQAIDREVAKFPAQQKRSAVLPALAIAQKEIGWFPVELTAAAQASPLFNFLPQRLNVFHWHGDTFALPPGATHIARSVACENQAFVFDGRVVGLQFHLEFTQESLDAIVAASPAELVHAPYVQTPAEMLRPAEVFQKTNEAMFGLLERLTQVTNA